MYPRLESLIHAGSNIYHNYSLICQPPSDLKHFDKAAQANSVWNTEGKHLGSPTALKLRQPSREGMQSSLVTTSGWHVDSLFERN